MTGAGILETGQSAGTGELVDSRWVWRLFGLAASLMAIGFVIQGLSHSWPIDDQLFLALNIVIEVGRIALCIFIFGVRWMTRSFRVDSRSLFISSAFLALGILAMARLLTFPGMPFSGSEVVSAPNFGTYSSYGDSLYYDIVIRISIGGLLIVGAFIPSSRLVRPSEMKYYPLGFLGFVMGVAAFISILHQSLPPLYTEAQGMTDLRGFLWTVALVLTFVAALVYAWLAGKSRDKGYILVFIGLLAMTEAQFSFLMVTSPVDSFMLIGRVVALVAWFVIFLGIVQPSLIRPYLRLEQARREIETAATDLAALSRNIMERREAEEKILRLNAELELKARALEASNKELESFCYSVSHDLRAPLRAIDGFSRFLIDEEGPALSEHAKDYVARMRNSCERMGLIIEDLLKLSRVVREELTIKEFDISAMARTVAGEIRASNPNRNVEFSSCGPEMVEGDERLLRIALENLLQNAWKFTSKTEKAYVRFGVTNVDGQRVFFVKDNGAGFDMRYYDKLFRPFERLHTDSEFPGTGVGLASVMRVVTRHGGRAWAEGKTGEGATFFFTLGKAS